MWAVFRQPAMSRTLPPSSPMLWLLWEAPLQAQVCSQKLLGFLCLSPGKVRTPGKVEGLLPEKVHLVSYCRVHCRSQCGERVHQLREEICLCGVQNR